MFKRITLITLTLMIAASLGISSFSAFNGYALRFNNKGTIDKLALTNTTVSLQNGYTRFTATAHDPNVIYAFTGNDVLNANQYKYLVIRYRTSYKQEGLISEMYFESETSGYNPAKTHITFAPNTENTWSNAVIDLSGNADWKGNIKSLRIDYLEASNLPANSTMDIEYIAVFATKAEADAFTGNFGENNNGGNNPPTGDIGTVFYSISLVAFILVIFKRKLAY